MVGIPMGTSLHDATSILAERFKAEFPTVKGKVVDLEWHSIPVKDFNLVLHGDLVVVLIQ